MSFRVRGGLKGETLGEKLRGGLKERVSILVCLVKRVVRALFAQAYY